ncbi:DUF2510 domain-containing protein [Agrococcus lahaulensis]|uniref:DUF2510 domain-containing protein n=1 Tax=Agrococcus lahaulensis TaxID=341722 RepID=UPI00047C36E6|nr:DUF2510 domain-containing protein [Agrococcus lahaulensis]
MPSFLIVHSAIADGRIDDFLHPPVLDIGGLHAPLDWGDITMHVPAGDLPLTISVTRADGVIEGARITVRAPAGTGTRLTFVPPARPGGRAQLRIEGQWPADSSMHYYAARDGRVLTSTAPRAAASPAVPGGEAALHSPAPASPPVGPAPGSTGSVPAQPTHFGQEQGAIVQPTVASRESAAAQRAASPSPSFGQRPPVERDVYGRELPDREPPPIPTPADFDRLEREAHVRAYEAWQAQQRAMSAPAGHSPHDGAPQPVGLAPVAPQQVPPDWYADPFQRADARWFDGRQWTSSVMRGGVRAHDQLG